MAMVMGNIWRVAWGACRDGFSLYSRCMVRI